MNTATLDNPKIVIAPDGVTQPLEDLDPSLPDRFQKQTHFAMFDRMRREAPVHYTKESEYGAYWSVTKYKDIIDIEIDHQTFSSDVKNGGMLIKDLPMNMRRTSFINADPPLHDHQRRVVSPIVAPANLGRLEHVIRAEAGEILDSLPRGETFNWVDKVSVELTGRVLCELMDFPKEDRRLLTYWSDIVNVDLAVGGDIDTEEKRYAKLKECAAYFGVLFQQRLKEEPKDDLISMLAHSEYTKNMPAQEFLGMIVLLMVGGNDTTRNSISGGLLALNQFPEQYAKLRANPALISTLVPEILRWVTPVVHMRRTAMRDVEFRGQTIRQGDKVIVWYSSGNRDEEMIKDPYQFIIDRANPRMHLSFGFGIHRCLGNRLAELQLTVLWQEILKRKMKINVVGEPVRKYANNITALMELPVQIEA
ncbi:MAG: cytochrome P450 [Janthinobacterium lividum]